MQHGWKFLKKKHLDYLRGPALRKPISNLISWQSVQNRRLKTFDFSVFSPTSVKSPTLLMPLHKRTRDITQEIGAMLWDPCSLPRGLATPNRTRFGHEKRKGRRNRLIVMPSPLYDLRLSWSIVRYWQVLEIQCWEPMEFSQRLSRVRFTPRGASGYNARE